MKIDSASIQLSSTRIATEQQIRKESLKAWIGAERPDFEGRGHQVPLPRGVGGDTADISAAARSQLAATTQASGKADEVAAAKDAVEPGDDPKMLLIRLIVERMTGKKIKLLSSKDIHVDQAREAPPGTTAVAQNQAPAKTGFGLEYDSYQATYESETTTFSASGVIKTADGGEIAFKLELTMSREFASEESVSIRAGDAVKKDPLVINFGGTAAQLTDTKFSFDLEADGQQDQISFVRSNSGFLALDGNSDGRINNGTELFGPTSGDGFAELAAYDADHNNWIDENDPVYAKLSIWSKDAQGKDSLAGLEQWGVGAIFLGKISTPFDLKTGQNQLLGQVKASGIYANENGSIGTIQQVDLAV